MTLHSGSLWLCVAVGVFSFAVGAATLIRQQAVFPWARKRARWDLLGRGQMLFGLGWLVATAPRLAGATAGWALIFTGVALVPWAASCDFMVRAKLPRT